ncbi:flagellar brake protein [Paraburkholderia dinghuensis]|uniref:Flagellar brake protein YcgR n=1 Tax=Paraburkholderia dinghuensis TaxID=2305225 RepID=A0A3N6MVP3_9BURK|nr:flagellar brake protein [Paraburkholderia dinghuensis]RQH06025.1 flagellar brake protein [Paraburkholderia dinghuensis]
MNTVQTNQQEQAEDGEDTPEFARRNPLEVGVQLRNLVNRGDFLTLQHRSGQLVTRILAVNTREHTFVFDWGALPEQNERVLESPECHFLASPDGVRVEFSTSTPRRTDFEGRPAFVASFPDVLYYVQRREYFRVDTPVVDPCRCRGTLPDGSPFAFDVHDVSLGGLGLRTTDPRAGALPAGAVLEDVEVDLRTYGKLRVDLALAAVRFIDLPNGERRYHLGMRFVSLPGSTENSLQRYITQVEMKRRALARA